MIKRFLLHAITFISMNAMSMGYVFQEGKGLEISWQSDDRIGITTGVPQYGYTEQLCFWASAAEGASRNHRSVYATGYKLKDATRYMSYYPYRWIADFNANAVSISYTGQQQTTSNSTAHLASYDYCAAAATPTNDACTFSYHHLSAFLRVTFTVPKDAAPTAPLTLLPSVKSASASSLSAPASVKSASASSLSAPASVKSASAAALSVPASVKSASAAALSVPASVKSASASSLSVPASTLGVEGPLPTEQTLNLQAQGTETELTTVKTGPLSIALGALTPGETYTAYMAMPKADLSQEVLTITLGDTPLATIRGFNAHPGCLYDIDLTTPPAASNAKDGTYALQLAASNAKDGAPVISGVPASALRVEGAPLPTAASYVTIDASVRPGIQSSPSGVEASALRVEGSPTLAAAVTTPTAYLPDILLDNSFVLERIPLPGDVNSDGTIDNTDADLIVQHYLGTLPDGAPFNPTAADINNDGAITISDANAIVNIITK